jgi:hypothetical protein
MLRSNLRPEFAAMLARYLNAPLLLLLWQVAPVDLHRDEGGRVRMSFGAGRGRYLFNDAPGYAPGVDCAGDSYAGRDPYTEASAYSTYGVAADVRATNTVRVRAAFGHISEPSRERHGEYGAAQAVLERKTIGIGLGLASLGGEKGGLRPSGSARFGPLDGIALRADYHSPEVGMGLTGGPRIGVILNQGASRKPRLFAGLTTTPVPDTARRMGGFVELGVPLGHRFGFTLNAFLSGVRKGNDDKQIMSVGLGGWIQP